MIYDSTQHFHAFLSHNSKNKPAVRELRDRLIAEKLTVWFDEDELRPGVPWQELLEAGIHASTSVVVLVGADGIGPWEDEEMQGALRLAVKDKRPVIPVLLPGCPDAPNLPMFLGNRTYVDLRAGFTEEALGKLLWGITGKKPKRKNSGEQNSIPPEIPKHKTANGPSHHHTHQPPPPPPPPPATLNQLVLGSWQVQIQLPYAPGMMGQLQVEMFGNGTFRGTLVSPMGVSGVEGQWQANPMLNQIGLHGFQSNGFQTIPYAVLVQVTFCNPHQIVGVTNAGEQVTWNRVGAPPQPAMY